MTLAPVVDETTGSVALAPETFTALVEHAADPAAAANAHGADEHLELLSQACLINSRGVLPRLADTLTAIVNPTICTLELRQSGKTMEGWADPSMAALLLPPDTDGRRTLASLHPSLLPEALARLVDLGPSPRAIRAEPLRAGESDLDRLLEGEPGGAAPGASPSCDAFGASSPASGPRRRWRLSTRWSLDDGRSGGAALEAIHTDDGIWLLEGEGDRLMAWPVTATTVWRLIVRLVMRRAADERRAIDSFS